jgi:hypothetical protein
MTMIYKELIIKIDNQNIHFSPTLSIPIRQSNLPMDYMTFRHYDDIYWKIELIEDPIDNKCLHVKVIDYNVDNILTFPKQTTKRQIEKVIFDKLDWIKLEPQLFFYQIINLKNILFNNDIKKQNSKEKLTFKPIISFNQSKYEKPKGPPIHFPQIFPVRHQVKREPIVENIKVQFSFNFKDAFFLTGSVTFKKYINKIGHQVEFEIRNEHILAEFDNIKSWFAKKLKTKRFKVSAIITVVDGQFSGASASSIQIAMITPDLIDSVKYDRTIALIKPPKTTNQNKSLYTSEDIFDLIDPENKEGNVFNQSELEVIKTLTRAQYVRNRDQLEYLSEKRQSINSKIRYTLSPHFGFLFLIEGHEKYHFVWELLNSHATYIWSIDKLNKQIEELYPRIEEIINIIRKNGREGYKSLYRNNNLDYDFLFKVIEHNEISINLNTGFVKWRSKLDEQLT